MPQRNVCSATWSKPLIIVETVKAMHWRWRSHYWELAHLARQSNQGNVGTCWNLHVS